MRRLFSMCRDSHCKDNMISRHRDSIIKIRGSYRRLSPMIKRVWWDRDKIYWKITSVLIVTQWYNNAIHYWSACIVGDIWRLILTNGITDFAWKFSCHWLVIWSLFWCVLTNTKSYFKSANFLYYQLKHQLHRGICFCMRRESNVSEWRLLLTNCILLLHFVVIE